MKVLNQQIIKKTNLKKVFSLISAHAPISRIKLAQMTSLSKTTISALVDELIVGGFILDEGATSTGRQGRKPNSLRVNSEENVVAVVNWHIEELEISLVDLAGGVSYYEVLPLQADCDFAQKICSVYNDILLKKAGLRRVLGFCLAVPSMLDPGNHKMISTVLPVSDADNVLERISDFMKGTPLAIFNDTACYAYAESTLSNLEFNTFTFININKGVGAIIVSDGQMIRGEGGMRSQLGHYSLDRNGAPCVCGNRGCLENEIGESALDRRAKKLGIYDELCVKGKITFESLGEMANIGDETAKSFVNLLAGDLAFTLGNVFTIYNTSHVVIGGKGQKLGEYYLNQLDKLIKEVGFKPFVKDIKIQYTTLGDDAIMRGAAKYFVDKYFAFFEDMSSFIVLE